MGIKKLKTLTLVEACLEVCGRRSAERMRVTATDEEGLICLCKGVG